MKKIMFISLLILLMISLSAVSANDDLNQNITETSDDQIEINNEDVLGASTARTFTDLQGQIMKTSAGETLTLYDDYEYTEGTDRTIGIAIYSTTKDITIDGNGHTLNGKNTARILYVNDGATNIVIKNLNFINGYNADGAGAIFWKGESGTISNCNFTSDIADKSGGAIIWAAATGTITDCKFEKCSSTSQSGGAIYATDASTQLTISNSKFISNTAKTSGAAIASAGANTIISNDIFTDNSASDSGAAIYLSGANTKIISSQFIRNTVAGSGGAIFWKGELGTLDKCNFTSNTAQDNGGAVFWATAKGKITNNRFEDCISKTQSGGAIYCNDLSKETTISNNVFIKNYAKTCGAGIGSAGASSIISDNIFTDNEVDESGAGLYTSGTKTKINNNKFLKNKAQSGGAVYIEIDSITMDGCYFEENSITGGGGGAMRWNGNSGTMTNCQFVNNKAATRGGALYWNGNDAKIENNNFTKNTADTAAGGGLLYWGNNGQILSNNFNENTATQGYGGGLYVDGTSTKVNNNVFNKNTAAKGGGAIYYDGASGTVSGNTITENTAENACGIRWNGEGATITSNTFKGNKNKNGQNIIYGDGARASVTKNTFINSKESDNCIKWTSADATISGNIYKQDTTTTLTGSDVTANYGESAKLTFTLKSSTQALSGKTVTVSLNNKNTNLVTDSNGQVSLDVSTLNAGTYTATAKFAGDSDYDASTASANVKINKLSTKTDLTLVKELHAGDEIVITASVNATEGNVTFNVGFEKETIQLNGGKATFTIPEGFYEGEYTVTAQYNGATNYLTSSDSEKFTVLINPTEMTTSNVTLYCGAKGEAVFTLVDYNNTPIENAEIQVSSAAGNLKTDSKGKIYVKIENLNAGTYQINATYAGSENLYLGSSATSTVTVKTTIESADLIAYYGNASYTAKFIDTNGTPLTEGTYVSFKIENEVITTQVDKDGSATVNIYREAGECEIENINMETGESTFNKITIKKAPTATDLILPDEIYAGERFEIIASVNATEGNVEFMVLPNSDPKTRELIGGNATLNISGFIAGDYNVTAKYLEGDNYLSSSDNKLFTILMNPTAINATDAVMYHGGKASITFTLLRHDGTPLKDFEIKVSSVYENITLKTDENGTVKLDFEKLEIGDYTIKAYFPGYDDLYLNSTATATLSVKPTIESEDLIADYNNATFTAKFVDANGTPLAEGTDISFTIDNDVYREKVDANGVATLIIDRDHGEYSITSINTVTQETVENKIIINQVATETTLIGVENIEIESSNTITARVNATEGIVIFNLNGTETVVNLTRGEAFLELNDMPLGMYTITATFIDEKENYLTSNATATFEVTKKITVLTADNVTMYYHAYANLTVTLTHGTSEALMRKEINLTSSRIKTSYYTDKNGQITLTIFGLEVGSFDIYISYEGDDEYMAANTTVTVTTKSTIEAEDLIADYKNATFTAGFVDSQGNPLPKGTNVTFIIDNDQYSSSVDDKGTASLAIEIDHGEYEITAINPVSEEMATYNITINQVATETVLSGINDSYVGDNMTILASVNTTEGIVILKVNENETTFNLTDGPVSLDLLSLREGTYTVTATYKDPKENYLESSVNATFNVIKKATTLTAENVTMYYGAIKNLTITLTDCESKAAAGKEINFTTSSGNATDFTDEKGQITKEVYGFEVGIFEVFLSFAGDDEYEASNTTITVTILTTLEAEDVVADYNNATFTARFLDSEGNPLTKGTNVSFFIEDEVFTALVGDDGVATAVIDVDHGTYTISSYNRASGQIVKNNITINQVATETILDGIADLNAGDNLTITASVNATEGAITFKVNEDEVTVNLTDGKAILDLIRIPEGSYTVTATYKDANDNYLTSSANATFKVTKKDNTITVETNNITEDEDAVFNVTATAPNGKVTLTINNKTYSENLTDGKATFTVSNLTAGDYPFKVDFEDDFYYASNSTEGSINVKSDNLVINAPDLTKYFSSPDRFLVTVTDKDGNPLENITIQIVLNGKTYNRTTNASGIAGMNINLGSSNYTADVIYAGDAEHKSVNVTANITILPTVFGDDVTKIQKGPEPYYATFLDSTGKVLADGTTIQFNINGVLYNREIKDGKGRLNLNLEPGTYIITAMNPVTGENAANTITILPRIVNNSDVTKFYKNGTQYYVTVLGDDGKPLSGGEVTFNINGVFYKRDINASGVARLNLNLEPGKYIITAEYNGCRVSNNITVLPVLSAKDITMKYRDGTKFEAKLVDGQGNPYPGQMITFNVNGVFYQRITGSDGIARLNINLMSGKYIITSSYNGANIANTITIYD